MNVHLVRTTTAPSPYLFDGEGGGGVKFKSIRLPDDGRPAARTVTLSGKFKRNSAFGVLGSYPGCSIIESAC
jgi:hypothetical protein